jgi:hypothetical protein
VPKAPDDIATRSCACKDSCDSRRCLCRRRGGVCKESCKCQAPDRHCANKFAYNGNLFGEAHTHSRATHCFADYVEKAEKIDFRRPYHDNGANIQPKNLESLLFADDDFFDELAELRDWRTKLDELESDERLEHTRWLFRLDLSIS